jgi:hypothetical protein
VTKALPEKRREEKSIKENKEVATSVAFVLPDWIEKETWDAFVQMRKRIGKPPTDYAKNLIVAKLERFKANGQDIKAVLEKSITSSWQDVFEIKPSAVDIVRQTVPMSKEPDAALEKIKADEKKAAPMPDHVREFMAKTRRQA